MKVQMSEARLNDFAYMALKLVFFGTSRPRECDIRIVMDMAVPDRITSPMQAILLPNEVSPRSHDRMHEVETDKVLQEAIDYVEDHWMKARIPAKHRKHINKHWPDFVKGLMEVPEEECAHDQQG